MSLRRAGRAPLDAPSSTSQHLASQLLSPLSRVGCSVYRVVPPISLTPVKLRHTGNSDEPSSRGPYSRHPLRTADVSATLKRGRFRIGRATSFGGGFHVLPEMVQRSSGEEWGPIPPPATSLRGFWATLRRASHPGWPLGGGDVLRGRILPRSVAWVAR